MDTDSDKVDVNMPATEAGKTEAVKPAVESGMMDVDDIASWVVLVVDDEPDNLSVPQQLLTHLGAKVYTAENGVAGMKVLDEAKPAPTLVLLDLSMPQMDGWAMLKEIHKRPAVANLPVIAVTAHAMVGDKERTLEAGFDSYISKPFLFDTFLSQIKDCLHDYAHKQKVKHTASDNGHS